MVVVAVCLLAACSSGDSEGEPADSVTSGPSQPDRPTAATGGTGPRVFEFPTNTNLEEVDVVIHSGSSPLCEQLAADASLRRLSSAMRGVFDERNTAARDVLESAAALLRTVATDSQNELGDASGELAAALSTLATAGPSRETVDVAIDNLGRFASRLDEICDFG